jgi:hypothetical protein
VCSSGYVLATNNYCAVSGSITGCTTYATATTCGTCDNGSNYFINASNTCTLIAPSSTISGCTVYTLDGTSCATCDLAHGWYKATGGGGSIRCVQPGSVIAHCTVYNGSGGSCHACDVGYNVQGGNCVSAGF